MANTLTHALTIFILPTTVLLLGGWIMNEISDRQQVYAALEDVPERDRKALNQRFGYDALAVDRHWGPIVKSNGAYKAERRFLELDLLFPFFYGAALASSLLMAWAYLGRPFSAAWTISPVAIMMIADWTENLVQLSRLHHYASEGIAALQNNWIHLASGATIVKLVSFGGIVLFIVVLIAMMFFRPPEPG